MQKIINLSQRNMKTILREKKAAQEGAKEAKAEIRFKKYVRSIARSAVRSIQRKSVQVHTAEEKPIERALYDYKSKLDLNDSEWAPWSAYARLAESMKKSRVTN